MNLLIRAELLKLKKNKLVYFGIILALLPLGLSALFMTGSDSFLLYGKYDLLGYTNGLFSTVILGLGIYAIYFAFIVNSIISAEINADIITYEIIGRNKRKNIYFAKMLTVVIFSIGFLVLALLATVVGFEFLIKHTEHVGITHSQYELGNFIYAIIYYFGMMIILSSLSFFGFGNGLVIGAFAVNLITMRLAAMDDFAPYIIGSPAYAGYSVYQNRHLEFLATHYILLITLVGICIYVGYYYFKRRDF